MQTYATVGILVFDLFTMRTAWYMGIPTVPLDLQSNQPDYCDSDNKNNIQYIFR